MVEDVLLKSTFPELLPAGASSGPQAVDWWPTETNRQGNGGPLSEEESRSTQDEERLLTKRCIERQWKNTSLEKKLI